MGARFGTVSCAISKMQRHSGLRLSLEPDPRAFQSLENNTHRNGCAGMNVNGVASRINHTWMFKWSGGYASQLLTKYGNPDRAKFAKIPGLQRYAKHHPETEQQNAVTVIGYSVAQLANFLSAAVGTHVIFDTLVVDCEGCFKFFMTEEKDFMKSPTLRRIVYELDERSDVMVREICAQGFGVAYDSIDYMLP